jgi:pheromone shutdown protein TraB
MAVRRLFRYKKIGESAAGRLSETDVLSAFLEELIPLQPALEEVLAEERDLYTAQKMRDAPGKKVVAVISAGRVAGVRQALETAGEVDLAELEQVPEVPPLRKWLTRIVPLLLLILIIVIGVTQGGEFVRENLMFWIVANSLFSGLGAILAGGHILTVLTAVVVAPISPFIPAGPGTVAAIVQAVVRPPLVRDFQTFADDITHVIEWRRNRLLKLFSVMILCGLGSIIGTLLGTSKIIFSFLGL